MHPISAAGDLISVRRVPTCGCRNPCLRSIRSQSLTSRLNASAARPFPKTEASVDVHYLAILDLNEHIGLSTYKIMVKLGIPAKAKPEVNPRIAFVRKEIVAGERIRHPVCPKANFVNLSIPLV